MESSRPAGHPGSRAIEVAPLGSLSDQEQPGSLGMDILTDGGCLLGWTNCVSRAQLPEGSTLVTFVSGA